MKDRSGPKAAPQTADQSNPFAGYRRFAEDGDVLLAEVDRWLDSIDCVVLAAQSSRSAYSAADALEFVLVGHGRVRRFLAGSRVAV